LFHPVEASAVETFDIGMADGDVFCQLINCFISPFGSSQLPTDIFTYLPIKIDQFSINCTYCIGLGLPDER
jgi:hypothetical protein